MINPIKSVLKKFNKEKFTEHELAQSKEFLDYALSHGFNVFDIALNKEKMRYAVDCYKSYKKIM